MTWRVLRTEIRRGPAPVAAVVTAGAGLLVVQGESFGARWMSFASAVQYSLYLVAPLVIAVAVWHGGREPRRRTGELLAATSRPRPAPVLVRWAVLTIGTTAGLLVVIGYGAGQVAPRASYSGGGWWWLLLAAAVGLGAVNAVGMLIGRVAPFRFLAPLVALVMFAALVTMVVTGLPARVAEVSDEATAMYDRVSALVPVRRTGNLDGFLVTTHDGISWLAWLSALGVAALVVLVSRRVVVRIAVCALPVAAAWYLGSYGGIQHLDEAALGYVCDGEQAVCVTRMNAYDIDAAAAAAEPVFDLWAGVDGAPARAREDRPGGDDAGAVGLFRDAGDWRAWFQRWPLCEISAGAERAVYAAAMWADEHATAFDAAALGEELRSWNDADQRAWMGRYLAAADACDDEGLVALAEELE